VWTKRILFILPLAVVVFLLQSYFWVPTYSEQARATPKRLSQYITASIGDAQILNPILNADSASSGICDRVFEGLIDRDKDLNWRARLAERWEIFEEAYFVVHPEGDRSPEEFVELIRSAKAKHVDDEGRLADCLRNVTGVEIQPGETVVHELNEKPPGREEDEEAERVDVTVTVQRPARIKLTLATVDQDLFETLGAVVGEGSFAAWDGTDSVSVEPPEFAEKAGEYAAALLPATEHNPVIVFHLRKGVLFHDGHEFDAGDVQFTYKAIMEPKNVSPRTSDYEPVKAVEVIDKYTVRVVYKELFSPGFASWGMQVLPEHLLNDEQMRREAVQRGFDPEEFNMRKSRFNQHPIGCGPFRFVAWQTDEFIKLARFDDYWEGTPEYKEYIVRIVPDQVTQEMEFYAGAIDGYGPRPNQVERLKEDERFQHFSGRGLGYEYIGYNMRRELFKDKRVRRALAMAINVDDIIAYVRCGQAERMTGPFPKQTDFYDDSVRPLPYDPEGALTLLEEVGWTRGQDGWLRKDGKRFAFTLITNNGNDIRRDIMAVAQDAWKKIGIQVETAQIEWAVFLDKYVDQGNFDACVLGWAMGWEPDLYQIWHSSQAGPRQLNFCAFKNAEADDLIVRIRREYDREKQIAMCHRLHRIIAEEQPYTFIWVGRWTALLDRRIVIVRRDDAGNVVGYEKIKATETGNYAYDFNRWIKLPEVPEFLPEP